MKYKCTPKFIEAIRNLKLAEPKISGLEAMKRLHITHVSRTLVQRVMYNRYMPDDKYWSKLALPGKTKSWVRHVEIAQNRKPSIDCACLCPTCGFGYDRMDEALDCCKRVKEA